VTANDIILNLSDLIGLRICDKHFNTIVKGAFALSWTRDPFDRIIVANAALNDNIKEYRANHEIQTYQPFGHSLG
jgi:PIN domain nuclease of toxin-antitoxin system